MAAVNIGGQAVLEGVMMKGKEYYAVAVRKADGTIVTEAKPTKSLLNKSKFFRLPLIRGVIVFIESLVLGVTSLNFSADLYGDEEDEEEPGKFEKWLMDKLGDKAEQVVMAIAMVIAFALSIGIFMILPMLIGNACSKLIPGMSLFWQNLVEGIVRILLFLGYMKLITLTKDIKRTFEYHGAEHKSINCLEQGKELTVENVRGCTRLHKSCGTSFLFVVMIISILVYSVFTTEVVWQRIVVRILMLPVVAGISYEFIRWARTHQNNKCACIFSAPGLWLQKKFTTLEPDDKQIEVAIAAVEGVFKYEPMAAQPTKPDDVPEYLEGN